MKKATEVRIMDIKVNDQLIFNIPDPNSKSLLTPNRIDVVKTITRIERTNRLFKVWVDNKPWCDGFALGGHVALQAKINAWPLTK